MTFLRARRWERLGASCALALISTVACGKATNPDTVVCAFNGNTALAPCPTLCEWQCDVARSEGCFENDQAGAQECTERCDAQRDAEGEACVDAVYDFWVCLRKSDTVTTCPSGEETLVRFAPIPGKCGAERGRARDRCDASDPLALDTAFPIGDGGVEAGLGL